MADKEVVVNREVAREFLIGSLEDIEVPADIPFDDLVEVFCQYAESDWYEWLRDNFKAFFDSEDPDWDSIREQIYHCDQLRNRRRL